MFWKFGYHMDSPVDSILDSKNVSLQALFEETELLQECKSKNGKLVSYLSKPEVAKEMIQYLITEDLPEEKKFKYPFLVNEILSCELDTVIDSMVSDESILKELWTVMDRTAPLSSLQATYFSRANCIFIEKKTSKVIQFIKSQNDLVSKILPHISSAPISELLQKLVSAEESPDGAGIVDWLQNQNLVESLIQFIAPTVDSETQNMITQTLLDIISISYQNVGPPEHLLTNLSPAMIAEQLNFSAQVIGGNSMVDEMKSEKIVSQLLNYMLKEEGPNSSASLINGVNILIELIRRYCSEIEQVEYHYHQFEVSRQQNRQSIMTEPSIEKLYALSIDLSPMLQLIGSHVEHFLSILKNPRSLHGPISTSLGTMIPLTSERLKSCELLAEILHLQYLYTSSPLFVKLSDTAKLSLDELQKISKSNNEAATSGSSFSSMMLSNNSSIDRLRKRQVASSKDVTDSLIYVTRQFNQHDVLPCCLQLFFDFPWNNFIHSVVFDMIAKSFNNYGYACSVATAIANGEAVEGDLKQLDDRLVSIRDVTENVVVSVLREGRLTDKIMAAQRENDFQVEQPKGVRLGYMGHLTYVTDEVCKVIEKATPELLEKLHGCIDMDAWSDYLNGPLKDTRERDQQVLGGARPIGGPNSESTFMSNTQLGEPPEGFIKNMENLKLADGDILQTNTSSTEPDSTSNVGTVPSNLEGFASDQFERYIISRTVDSLPPSLFGFDDEDDDDKTTHSGSRDMLNVSGDLIALGSLQTVSCVAGDSEAATATIMSAVMESDSDNDDGLEVEFDINEAVTEQVFDLEKPQEKVS